MALPCVRQRDQSLRNARGKLAGGLVHADNLARVKLRSRLLNLATLIALLLCVALSVLWWRSYRSWDKLVSRWPAEGVGIASASGRVILNIRWTRIANDTLVTGFRSDKPQTSITISGGRIEVIEQDPLPTN